MPTSPENPKKEALEGPFAPFITRTISILPKSIEQVKSNQNSSQKTNYSAIPKQKMSRDVFKTQR